MAVSYDVVIVGGAVVGSTIGYFLSQDKAFRGRVAVIERDPTFRRASTTLSAGGLRQQFSLAQNIALSQASLALLRQLSVELGAEADVGFKEQGYLMLATETGWAELQARVAMQRRQGADIEALDAPALEARFPWLATAGLAGGALGRSGEGWLDGALLLGVLRGQAAKAGVDLITGEVVGIDIDGERVSGVRLADGTTIRMGALVNAAGPHAGAVARLAGVELPVEPRKRYVFVLDCRTPPTGLAKGPLIVDPSGVWMRPEGTRFIAGLSPDRPEDEPSASDLEFVDHAWWEERVWPRLAARIPAFEAAKVVGAWAGHYDVNTFDANAIIGPHPRLTNLYFVNGFSGHGLQQALAAGRGVAEHITYGAWRTLNLSAFAYERIARGERLEEAGIV